MEGLRILLSNWHTRTVDGNLLNMCDLRTEDARTTARLHSGNMFWQRLAAEHDIVLVGGVWTEPAPGIVKRKINEVSTSRRAAHAISCLVSGAWTQKRRHDKSWFDVLVRRERIFTLQR